MPPASKYGHLVDATSGEAIIEHLEIADTVWTRFRGWMLRRRVPTGSAILIRPCASIHTMWMRMAIDVAFLSKDNTVLGVRKHVRPWRIVVAPKGTTGVLETPAGQTDVPVGTRLRIEQGKR